MFVPVGVLFFDRPLSVPYGENANIPFALLKDILGLQKFHSYNMTWWFNQIIIILWIAFPVLYLLVKNRYATRGLLLVAVVAFPANALAFLLGMYVANYRDGLEKIIKKLGMVNALGCLAVLLLLLGINRECGYVECLASLKADPYIAMLLSVAVAILTKKISCSMPVLSYLGKHSMNMYMVHTFIFAYFFHDFIYGFQFPVLIFLALLLSSLGVSFVLEYAKRKLGFYSLIQYISSQLSA